MEQLSPEVEALLSPVEVFPNGVKVPSLDAHLFREARLNKVLDPRLQQKILGRRLVANVLGPLPYLTEQGILDTYKDTQESYENHRRLTPRLQEILHYPDTRAALLENIEERSQRETERLLRKARRNNGQLQCDVAILGGGSHGTAAAMMVREQFPNLRIFIVDENGLGGQWGSYGPNPSYWMNSRVRKANRNLPPIPRTPGSINPLGRYATLELSDIVRGHYALNTEMAAATKVNGYMSVDSALIGVNCEAIIDTGTQATMVVVAPNGDQYDINAGVVINACGIDQRSTLNPSKQAFASPYYLNTRGIYRHYGNYERTPNRQPLERFHQKRIVVAGDGDAALTAMENTLGKLPKESYGVYGPGRYRPALITWIGAPALSAIEIDDCLRSRYKDSIVQALPKNEGDQGATIRPVPLRAKAFQLTASGVEVVLANKEVISADILFDCTNQASSSYGPVTIDARKDPNIQSAVFKVGPGAKLPLPQKIQEVRDRLGIPENTASLWALMELTDQIAQRAGELAVRNAIRREV